MRMHFQTDSEESKKLLEHHAPLYMAEVILDKNQFSAQDLKTLPQRKKFKLKIKPAINT